MISISDLPAVNAGLNATSAALLVCGYAAIRRKRIVVHRGFMIAAFACSTLFLTSYVIYHANAGSVAFGGSGWARPLYFLVLISHILLAAALLPLVLITLALALRGRQDSHRRIARWTFPIWMYVSVTGVLIYVSLYLVYGPADGGRSGSGGRFDRPTHAITIPAGPAPDGGSIPASEFPAAALGGSYPQAQHAGTGES